MLPLFLPQVTHWRYAYKISYDLERIIQVSGLDHSGRSSFMAPSSKPMLSLFSRSILPPLLLLSKRTLLSTALASSSSSPSTILFSKSSLPSVARHTTTPPFSQNLPTPNHSFSSNFQRVFFAAEKESKSSTSHLPFTLGGCQKSRLAQALTVLTLVEFEKREAKRAAEGSTGSGNQSRMFLQWCFPEGSSCFWRVVSRRSYFWMSPLQSPLASLRKPMASSVDPIWWRMLAKSLRQESTFSPLLAASAQSRAAFRRFLSEVYAFLASSQVEREESF